MSSSYAHQSHSMRSQTARLLPEVLALSHDSPGTPRLPVLPRGGLLGAKSNFRDMTSAGLAGRDATKVDSSVDRQIQSSNSDK